MPLACKLNRNITINDTGSSTDIGCGNTQLLTGGIRPVLYIYNIDDVQNLIFENDSRWDDNLIVETIVSSNQFFYVEGTSITYNENYDDEAYTHTLTLNLSNIYPVVEDILNEAVNSKFLVAFLPNGAEHYRLMGWESGASLTYQLDITETDGSYKLVFEYNDEIPLLACYKDNFDLKSKVFIPIFNPLYEISYCQQTSTGYNNGYVIASYVVKQNTAGQPLDMNNMLCEYSGNKQDAYYYNGITPSTAYNLLGSYSSLASFDGKAVMIYDATLCPPNVTGTITVSPNVINLYSANTSSSFTVTLTDNTNSWKIKNTLSYVILNPTNGQGTTGGTVIAGSAGGTDIIQFQNRNTYEQQQMTVNVYYVKCPSSLSFPNSTTQFFINVSAEGGSTQDYSYTTPSGLTIIKETNGLNVTVNTQQASIQTFSITVTHNDFPLETKTIEIIINGVDTSALWMATGNQYCEDL